PFGLPVMHEKANEFATAFRGIPQAELMQRLRDDFHKMQELLDALGPDDWTGLMVTHAYMGPVPASCYAAGHLAPYRLHWCALSEKQQRHADVSAETSRARIAVQSIEPRSTRWPNRHRTAISAHPSGVACCLDVLTRQVGQAGDGRGLADRGVGPVVVVLVDP